MKNKVLKLCLVALSMVLAGCNNTSNSSSTEPSTTLPSNVVSTPTSTPTTSIDSDVHVTSIEITNKDVTTLKVGQKLRLLVTVMPSNATNTLINYSSSDESVATVSFNGEIYARKEGQCVITAKSDDGDKTDSITIEVVKSSVTSFNVAFDSSVETIVENGTTYYKMYVGKSYPLDFTYESDSEDKEVLEASFEIKDRCLFDSATNTLTPIAKTEKLAITFSVKDSKLTKVVYAKILIEGEQSLSEAVLKLNNSIEKESAKTINKYQVDLDFDTIDIYGTREHDTQSTTFNIYRDSTDRSMVGEVVTNTSTLKANATKPTQAQLKSSIYKGMSADNYYEFQVTEEGYHLVNPSKRAIVESVSDSKTQITRSSALEKSTKIIMNSQVGLSQIALFQITKLYENSIGFGSIPMYFGAKGSANLVIIEENNVLIADTFFVEALPSNQSNGEAYFNHGEYTFNEEGIIIGISVTSYMYDNTSYDFETNTLCNNPQYVNMYKTEYTQTFGELSTNVPTDINPNNLYFASYTPAFANAYGYEATKFSVGQTYYVSFKNPTPIIADSRIDSIIIDESSDPTVASITNDGRSILIKKSGVTTLTIYSSKNRVMTQFVVNVDAVTPTSIESTVNNVKTSSIDTKVGETVNNIKFNVLPTGAPQDVETSVDGAGTLTKNSDGSYSFVSNEAGTNTITITSKANMTITTTLTINVKDNQGGGSLIDNLLNNQYVLAIDTEEIVVQFTSQTKATVKLMTSRTSTVDFVLYYDVEIDDANKTIKFSNCTVEDYVYERYLEDGNPAIQPDVTYSIKADGSEFYANVITDDSGNIVDYISYDTELSLHTFSIDK